jgi:hypothetical protein
MSGTSIALKIGSLVLGMGVFLILFKKVKGLKKYGLVGFLYVFLLSIILSLPSMFLLFGESLSEFSALLFAQSAILIIGVLHVFLSKKIVPWFSEQIFNIQLVLIITILLFGYFFTNLSLSFLVTSELPLIWYLSLLWFVVPILLEFAINRLLEVPEREFKTWFYPVGENIEDPSDEELENPVVISFIFRKTIGSKEQTTFRAKAPVAMSLGKLFFFFISDYNSRHPEEMISYLDEENSPLPWTFFKVKNKWLKIKESLDPDDSIYNNNIKENDLLICHKSNTNIETEKDESTK